MSVHMKIDLNDYRSAESRVFAGRSRGQLVRARVDLNRLDESEDPVDVVIPADTISINSSFFLGMFADSIRSLGEAKFRSRYRFLGPDIGNVIEDGIREALRKGSPLT